MKRASKLAEFRKFLATSRFSHCNNERIARPPIRFLCQDTTQTHSGNEKKVTNFGSLASLFTDKLSYNRTETNRSKDFREKVAGLREEILAHRENAEEIEKILEENGALFRRYPDGSAIVELLRQLQDSPSVAMEVIYFISLSQYFIDS